MRRSGITWNRGFSLVGLGLLLGLQAGCGEDSGVDLISVPTEKEANRVLVALETEGGITAANKESEKSASGRGNVWKIKVPQKELSKARALLVKLDLPREAQPGFEEMLKQGGLIPTKTDERAKLMHAMAGELARTFEAFDRVIQARVHLVIPERDPLQKTVPEPRAMVFIKYASVDVEAGTNGTPAAPTWLPEDVVKKMVKNSIEGLDEKNVEVAYAHTLGITASGGGDGGSEELKKKFADQEAELQTLRQRSKESGTSSKTAEYILGSAAVGLGLLVIIFSLMNASLRRKLNAQRATGAE